MRKRACFLNKKGQLMTQRMMIHLGMLAIAAFVWYLLSTYVKSIEKDTEFHRIVLSRDIALLMNTLYSAPGDVNYVYSNDKLLTESISNKFGNEQFKAIKFQFDFVDAGTPTTIIKEGAAETSYPYAKPAESPYANSVQFPVSIGFSKKDNIITAAKNG